MPAPALRIEQFLSGGIGAAGGLEERYGARYVVEEGSGGRIDRERHRNDHGWTSSARLQDDLGGVLPGGESHGRIHRNDHVYRGVDAATAIGARGNGKPVAAGRGGHGREERKGRPGAGNVDQLGKRIGASEDLVKVEAIDLAENGGSHHE